MLILVFIICVFLGSEASEPRFCAWSLTNSGLSLAQQALRDFNFPPEASISPKFNSRVRRIIYDVFEGKDFYTGKPIEYYQMTIDHIIPLSLGGLDNAFNFVPTVRKVNEAKGNSFILDRDIQALIEVRDVYGPRLVEALEREGLFQAYAMRPNQRGRRSQTNSRRQLSPMVHSPPVIRVRFSFESDDIFNILAELAGEFDANKNMIAVDSKSIRDRLHILESLRLSVELVSSDGRERTDSIVDLVNIEEDFESDVTEILLHPFIANDIISSGSTVILNSRVDQLRMALSTREITNSQMNEILNFDF